MQKHDVAIQEQDKGPLSRLTHALHLVRENDTHQLIESFTSEMTLVAEGLCEDQRKIRRDMEDLYQQYGKQESRTFQEIDHLSERLDQQDTVISQRLSRLEERLEQIEKQQEGKKIRLGRFRLPGGLMQQLIILASIIGGAWVLVTLLNLIRDFV